ncbi:MAG: DUF4271 domain-containing protein [Cyclobacteriaceae bacterium]
MLVLLSLLKTHAQEIIHDFSFDQLDFNSTSSSYEPIAGVVKSTVYVFLDTKKYADYFFTLAGEGSGIILINGQLVFQPESRRINQTWSIDSLAKQYRTDSVLISLSGFNNTTAQVIQGASTKINSAVETQLLSNKRIQLKSDKNIWVILLLLLGLILGVYRMKYPKSFSSLFDASDIFRLRPRESVFYELKIMQAQSLVHYIAFAILSTLFISKNWNSLGLKESLATSYLMTLLVVFLLASAYHLIKFVTISFFAELFGLNAFTKFHYGESVRFSLVILSVAVLLSFFPINELTMLESKTLLTSLLILSVALIFIKLLNKTLDKKLYLFSYICTTEIIPLLFIIKVFI